MNILLFNCAWNNRGDESAIRAMIDELKGIYPDVTFEIFNHQQMLQFPYSSEEVKLTNVPYFNKKNLLEVPLLLLSRGRRALFSNSKALIQSVKNADLVMHAPGGPSMGDIYKTTQFASYFKFFTAKLQKKPYMFYAPSMGPFEHPVQNILRKIIFNHAVFIATREELSAQYLKKLHLKQDVIVTMDSAIQHPIDIQKYEAQFNAYTPLKDFIGKYKKVVGITIAYLTWNPKYKDKPEIESQIKTAFHQTVEYLTQRQYGVVFIPQLFGESNDYDYLRQFQTDHCFIMDDQHDCYFQQYVISKLHMVIGLRYHSNIFSAKMKTPFISVSYEQKMRGFAQMVGMDNYCMDVNQLSGKALISKVQELEANYDTVKAHLEKENEHIIGESSKTTKLVCNYINTHIKKA